ncbi:hypothetical protein HZA96_01915 [Candidatus Woesearchaeota archaeon]|nr:hypothetical protein [Candidatus Woesearchaeota archaeon]
MGKIKYLDKIEKLFEKSIVVDNASLQKYVKDKSYTKQIVHHLLRKGKIKKITKGLYTIHNDPQLAVFCFKPAYLGLQDALSMHNLWEQETIPIIITTRKIRQGIRTVFGANVLIRRIEKKHFFGYEHMQQGNLYLPYSDIEKTFIDLVYYNEQINDETLKMIRKKINNGKLLAYLKDYNEITKKRVLSLIEIK